MEKVLWMKHVKLNHQKMQKLRKIKLVKNILNVSV